MLHLAGAMYSAFGFNHPLLLTPPCCLAQPPSAAQVHLFCAVYFMLYMIAFTGITIW